MKFNKNLVIGLAGMATLLVGSCVIYRQTDTTQPVEQTNVLVPVDESQASMVSAPTQNNPDGDCFVPIKGPQNEIDYIVEKCKK